MIETEEVKTSPAVVVESSLPDADLPETIPDVTLEAQKACKAAIKRLKAIAKSGPEMAAIKAAALLLTWGYTSPNVARDFSVVKRYEPPKATAAAMAASVGKREQTQINAEKEARGIYAPPPPPPRLAVDNT